MADGLDEVGLPFAPDRLHIEEASLHERIHQGALPHRPRNDHGAGGEFTQRGCRRHRGPQASHPFHVVREHSGRDGHDLEVGRIITDAGGFPVGQGERPGPGPLSDTGELPQDRTSGGTPHTDGDCRRTGQEGNQNNQPNIDAAFHLLLFFTNIGHRIRPARTGCFKGGVPLYPDSNHPPLGNIPDGWCLK